MFKQNMLAINKISLIGALFSSVMLINHANAAGITVSIVEQKSIIAENIKKDAEECAEGTKEGTIGHAIKDAMKIHLEIGSAPPEVQRLFDVDSDCFADLNKINDLSFAIPSVGTIVSAASDALLKYAQKKVCTAVYNVSGLVTTPLNKAIDKANNIMSGSDLNGLTNGLINQGMTLLDPNLGSEYLPAPGSAVNVTVDPFGPNQLNFNNGATPQSFSAGAPVAATQPLAENPESSLPLQQPQAQQQPKSGDVHSRAGSLFG